MNSGFAGDLERNFEQLWSTLGRSYGQFPNKRADRRCAVVTVSGAPAERLGSLGRRQAGVRSCTARAIVSDGEAVQATYAWETPLLFQVKAELKELDEGE